MTLEGGRTTIPIVVDTDLGTNFDDALALAYLARQPRCELLGVTTVTGDTRERARSARAILAALGRSDVPVHAGLGEPLSGPGQPDAPQAEAVSELSKTADEPLDASEFLGRSLAERPGEITLLTLGPMTNVAAVLARDPRALDRAHAVVSMLGSWDGGGPETNAKNDPEAARRGIVARHRGHRFVGLDATASVGYEQDRARKLFERLGLEPLLRMQGRWLTDARNLPCHDAIAAASVFAPDLCGWIGGDAAIGSSGKTTRLATNGPFAFATSVASERFLLHLEEILSQ